MRRMCVWIVAAAMFVVGVTGCSSASRSAAAAGNAAPARAGVRVHVENNNYADMNIFVVDGGMRMRVGFVPGHSTADLQLRRPVPTGLPMRIIGVPIGGGGVATSEPLTLFGGESVTFMVQPQLAMSFAMVR
jgi:uncharacterized lipoprotein